MARLRLPPLPRWRPALRLMPLALLAAGLLMVAKLDRLLAGLAPGPAVAQSPPPAQTPPAQAPAAQAPPTQAPATQAPAGAPPAAPSRAQPAPPPAPAADDAVAAERAVLEALRARRAEIESREQAIAAREVVLAAAERRLGQRVEELSALQQRLEALERDRASREEQGFRALVKLYEGMRPRDAAVIFDELDLPVLVRILDRMREARAAPVLGAMRPERARLVTAELARLRTERPEAR